MPSPSMPVLKQSSAVVAALRQLYPSDRYAFVEEVANSTGTNVRGWADVVAVGLWPSRGLDITGIEVKVSRQDWLRELENGGKAENVARFCDYWFLAVGDERLVHEGELPTTWGLIVPDKNGKLRHAKAATKNEAPEFSRGFMASVLRHASKPDVKSLQEEYLRGVSVGKKEIREAGRDQAATDSMLRDYERLKKTCAEFEAASGVNLSIEYNGKRLGEAVHVLMYGGIEKYADRLDRLAGEASQVAEQAMRAAKTLRDSA